MSTLLMAKTAKTEQKSDDARWRAVMERDATQDGRFVYAVHTTGVYCRPVCPSRRALRRNVSFYKSALAARAGGFRACKRCRPDQAEMGDRAREKVVAACRYLEAQSGRIPKLDELGAEVGLSPAHLQRVFKRIVGVSPRKYADALRVDRLKKELQSGEAIAGALYATGYGSTSRLYEGAAAALGMTPSAYRKKAPGARIRFVTLASPVGGHILVAATERGICAIRLGDRTQPLVDELRAEFAGASFERGDEAMRASLAEKIAAGGNALADLPRDVQATAFQRRVWEAIRAIPEGTTATYGAVAASIGKPSAVRAVAQACASNPIALLVPCHRVVPKAGGSGGYRWGEKRKRALLALEKKRAQG